MKLLINAVVELFIAVLRKMVYQRNEKNVESFCIDRNIIRTDFPCLLEM